MILASAQTKPKHGDIRANLVDHERMIDAAAQQGADLILFPEMSITGYERDRAAELLARMGERAAPAEGKMIEIVSRSTLNRDQYGSEVRRQAVRVLGNLRSSDGRAIAGLCDLLASTEYRMPDDAIEALTRIGAPAVPQLRRKLFDRFGSVQYRAAVILGQIGAPARAALPDLQKLADTTLNGDIRNAAMQAVQQIRK